MRYIHDGEIRYEPVEPPMAIIFPEENGHGTGKTNTAIKTAIRAQELREGDK